MYNWNRIKVEHGESHKTAKVYVNDEELHGVRGIDYHISVDEISTATVEVLIDGFEAMCRLEVDFTPKTLDEAMKVIACHFREYRIVKEINPVQIWRDMVKESEDEEIRRVVNRISELMEKGE